MTLFPYVGMYEYLWIAMHLSDSNDSLTLMFESLEPSPKSQQ